MPEQTSAPINLEYYGPAALMAVSQLIRLLVSKGTITRQEGSEIWQITAEGLRPQDHPGIRPIREMLMSLSRSLGELQDAE
jgi:hypothetical protein